MKKTFFYVSIIILFFSCNIQKNTQKNTEYLSLCDIRDSVISKIDNDLPTIIVLNGVPVKDICSNIRLEISTITEITIIKDNSSFSIRNSGNTILITTNKKHIKRKKS